MFQLRSALDQCLPLGDDLTSIHATLLGDVAIDAICRVADMQVETGAERSALTIVPSEVEGCGP